MRWILVLVGLVSVFYADHVSAQTSHGEAYIVSGPGKFGDDAMVYTSAAAEYITSRGIGAALELGRVSGVRSNAPGGPSRSAATAGINLVLPLATGATTRRVQPFAIAGLAFLSNPLSDSSLAYMFGGGANVWIGKHVGARLDFRMPIALLSGGGGIAAVGMVVR